jgi:hypothetical protein
MVDDRKKDSNKGVDLDKIAKIVVDYYESLVSSPDGRVDPEDLISGPLSPEEREVLRERLSDVDFLYKLTAPLRNAQIE